MSEVFFPPENQWSCIMALFG